MDFIPTVRVGAPVTEDNSTGFIVINEVDFDKSMHTLYDPEGAKKADPKPSDGLTVEQLKAALTTKEIAIPEGAKKADLQDLLDAAPATPAA